MVSVDGMTDADRAPASGAASKTVLARTHSTVCARRTARLEHHTVSGRRHHQIGHRERQPGRSRYHSGSPGHHSVPAPHPPRRSVLTCLVFTAVLGMLYLALIEVFGRDTHPGLIWFGLLVIVFGGAVVENAIRLDGMTEHATTPQRSGRSAVETTTVRPGLPA